ncbi:hypothetical protein FOMPIDRAFT_1137597 [Fomitopsis schrenkii]|uniref:Uncharacterized protein n=1 Tax=Fomitopsis schrenkii TaxID=2126942 RepID=S8DHW3_FOMSC|nr:hypothetical protein FOMPIDRAFT_1137597 [Fomitopsis schrenkii]
MHSVFLRIVQHHLRVILGMDLPADDVDDATTEPMIQASTEKALVKIHGSLTPSCTAKFLERFSKPALWEACRRYGVDLSGTSYKKAKKRTLCNALIVSSHSIPRKPVSYAVQEHAMPTTLPTVPAEGTGTRPSSEIVGNDFVTDVTSLKSTNGPSSFFTKDDLSDFQYVITTTLRPSHSTGSPAKIGTKAHGKLKADQWKAVIEFELPVYLMTKWWASDPTMLNEKERIKHELAVNTMELACAIRQNDISQHLSLLPSHHKVLHIPQFLRRFGPMPGWWMFAFERIIGLLQKVKTNRKLAGQLERTMLESFCAAANIKMFVQHGMSDSPAPASPLDRIAFGI